MEALLAATSAQEVQSIVMDAFRYRNESINETRLQAWATLLQSSIEEMKKVNKELVKVIQDVLYLNVNTPEEIVELFPKKVDAKLVKLVTKIVYANLEEWKESCTANQIAAPKLVDFDWRVDLKTSSNLLTHMSVPTVIVDMKIQDVPSHVSLVPSVRDIQFELSKEALQTTIDGLLKIRDQLGAIH